MTLENVLNEIHAKGQQDISRIIQEGQAEAEKIITEAKDKLKELEDTKQKETNEKVKQLKVQELSVAELEAKKNILNMQKELLDNLRQQILSKLSGLSPEKNQQYLSALINQAKIEFPAGKIYCNAKDEAFVKSKSDFQFGGEIDCIGGLLVENENGSINMDFTFENILDEVWKDVMKDISKLLFKTD